MWDQRGTFGESYFADQEREAEERGRQEQAAITSRRAGRSDAPAALDGYQEAPQAPSAASRGGAGAYAGAASGSDAGKQAAMSSGNPYAIAAAAVKSWLDRNHRQEGGRTDFKRNMQTQRAAELGHPTYGMEYDSMRKKQDRDPLGSIYYDPMGS